MAKEEVESVRETFAVMHEMQRRVGIADAEIVKANADAGGSIDVGGVIDRDVAVHV